MSIIKTAFIGFRTTPSFKKFLSQKARKDGRTLTNYIEKVLCDFHGYNPDLTSSPSPGDAGTISSTKKSTKKK